MKNNIPPVLLVILDGFGYSANPMGNAINSDSMPHWHEWLTKYPNTLLHAAGKEIGLLDGYIGNSEIGHQAIGTGRIIPSKLRRIHDAIADRSFFTNPALVESFKRLKESSKALHIIGLLSDSGVHSHEEHIYAFLDAAVAHGITNIFFHLILDGRDVPPVSAAKYVTRLEEKIRQVGAGTIATLHGRFYAMDRDNNWERTKASYDVLTQATSFTSPLLWRDALKNSYDHHETDEFVHPIRLTADGVIGKDDAVIFANFRADRARQLSEAFLNPDFDHFATAPHTFGPDYSQTGAEKIADFITPILYNDTFTEWNNTVLYYKKPVEHTLVEAVIIQTPDQDSPKVFAIAETEKYAHVTYFFNGGDAHEHPGEERLLIPSIKSKNYIGIPQMSAPQITDAILHSIRHHPSLLYVINYANLDMVGHSGDLLATIKAAALIDDQLSRLYEEAVLKFGATMYITGDHGNAEEKIDLKTGLARTAHTTNPVPFMMITPETTEKNVKIGGNVKANRLTLANIAPTILHYMRLPIPPEMEQTIVFPEPV